MAFRTIMRLCGILIMIFSLTMIPPIFFAIAYKDGGGISFFHSFIISLFIGTTLWYLNRNSKDYIRIKDGILIVVLFWVVLGSIGTLPFILTTSNLSLIDSFFESFSALTTTGATVMTNLDIAPKAILFYRSLLQWLGGMGLIVLAVAILPMLGIGGMQLYKAEIPGPIKDSKMTPKLAETAKYLWSIYFILTVLCGLSYWIAGMTGFDAIVHSFSTIAIGGMSSHDASLGYFNNPIIDFICVFFLLVAGCNFSLHFAAIYRGKFNAKIYLKDTEFKIFMLIQIIIISICFITITIFNVYEGLFANFNHAILQSVSIATTAGFTTQSFHEWPLFIPVFLIFSSFIGGCAGSTAGGIKVLRAMLLTFQINRELKRIVHPRAIFPIRFGKQALPDRVVQAVWGFFSAYILVFLIGSLILMSLGLDAVSSFSATAACLNNLGPGLGAISMNYSTLSDPIKIILTIIMLFGRLEIFTLLVLFTPWFWKE